MWDDEMARDMQLLSDFHSPTLNKSPIKTTEKELERKKKIFKSIYDDDYQDLEAKRKESEELTFEEHQNRIAEEIRAVSNKLIQIVDF